MGRDSQGVVESAPGVLDQLSVAMKLALITQDFPPSVGGIQTYCRELAQRFERSLTAFTVFAPRVPRTARLEQELGVEVVRCPGSSDALPLSLGLAFPAAVLRGQVDTVLHAQWQTLPVSVALKRLGLLQGGVFAAAHGRELLLQPLGRHPRLQWAYDRVRRYMLQAADGVFPVSRYTADRLLGLGVAEARCHVVPNGVDVAHFRPSDATALRQRLGLESSKVLLFAGRLQPNKGVDTVLQALPALLTSCPELVFLVVGTGPDKGRLEALAKELGVMAQVRFLGRVPFDDLPRYYSLADLFVTLSREEPPSVEGFGLVFLEAGACGTAVIGSRSGGIPDAIRDGETGRLIPPGDPEALVRSALPLLQDAGLARHLGEAGRAYVTAEGHWDRTHDRLLAQMSAGGAR